LDGLRKEIAQKGLSPQKEMSILSRNNSALAILAKEGSLAIGKENLLSANLSKDSHNSNLVSDTSAVDSNSGQSQLARTNTFYDLTMPISAPEKSNTSPGSPLKRNNATATPNDNSPKKRKKRDTTIVENPAPEPMEDEEIDIITPSPVAISVAPPVITANTPLSQSMQLANSLQQEVSILRSRQVQMQREINDLRNHLRERDKQYKNELLNLRADLEAARGGVDPRTRLATFPTILPVSEKEGATTNNGNKS